MIDNILRHKNAAPPLCWRLLCFGYIHFWWIHVTYFPIFFIVASPAPRQQCQRSNPEEYGHMSWLRHDFTTVKHCATNPSEGYEKYGFTLQWRHNKHDGVSNHQPNDCFFNRLFRRRSKKTSKLGVTGLCEGNSPVIVEFPSQWASNAGNICIWWRHHVIFKSEQNKIQRLQRP